MVQAREQAGEFTFEDIIRELEKPGRDPRDEFVPFQYREDIHELKDLKLGMMCPGIVTNVTNFGAGIRTPAARGYDPERALWRSDRKPRHPLPAPLSRHHRCEGG